MKKGIFIIILSIIALGCLLFLKTKINTNSSLDNNNIDTQKNITRDNSDFIKQPDNITVIKSYDILNYSENNASRILSEYLILEIKKESPEIQKYVMQEHELSPKTVRAFEYDLNCDGINEVIGIPPINSYYGGVSSIQFFILQKSDEKYTNISELLYSFEDRVNILSSQTNKFNDMQFADLKENSERIKRLKKLGLYKENLGHIIKYDIPTSKYSFKYYKKQ